MYFPSLLCTEKKLCTKICNILCVSKNVLKYLAGYSLIVNGFVYRFHISSAGIQAMLSFLSVVWMEIYRYIVLTEIVHLFNGPFAAEQSSGTKSPNWRANDAPGYVKQSH